MNEKNRFDWAIRPWIQLAFRDNFLQLLQFHFLLSIRFHFSISAIAFVSSHVYFNRNFAEATTWYSWYIYTYILCIYNIYYTYINMYIDTISISISIYLSIPIYIYIYIYICIYIPWLPSLWVIRLTLNASWNHDLITQSVKASERSSVVMGSNPTQANFL